MDASATTAFSARDETLQVRTLSVCRLPHILGDARSMLEVPDDPPTKLEVVDLTSTFCVMLSNEVGLQTG